MARRDKELLPTVRPDVDCRSRLREGVSTRRYDGDVDADATWPTHTSHLGTDESGLARSNERSRSPPRSTKALRRALTSYSHGKAAVARSQLSAATCCEKDATGRLEV